MVRIGFVGEAPDLDPGLEIVLEDGIRREDLITFVALGDNKVAIRSAGPDYRGEAYRVDPQSTREELILVRVRSGNTVRESQEERQLEHAVAEAFSSTGFFYRDTNLDEILLSRYRPSMFLQERAFVDCTYLRGGLAATHRYLIITGEAMDLHAIAGVDKRYGPAILNRDSFFKVLDVQHSAPHGQIVLLHVPEPLLDVMEAGVSPAGMERAMVEAARADFGESLKIPPVQDLVGKEWLDRVAFPIGMSEEGELFYKRQSGQSSG